MNQRFLKSKTRPAYEDGQLPLRMVDLFCGCGGLTLGVAEAARAMGRSLDIRLAVDNDPIAIETYETNFPKANAQSASVESFFDGRLGSGPTKKENATQKDVGDVFLLAGGPPCQGHSDLNNHSRRDDERNALYARMARAAEILKPDVVLIENVPAVVHDKDDVVATVRASLVAAGYQVADDTISLHEIGIPQKRRRHILLAARDEELDPSNIFKTLKERKSRQLSVKWAIGDLEEESDSGFHSSSEMSKANQERVQYLFQYDKLNLPNELRPVCHRDKAHTYNAMYGRLSWDSPAPTITTGFGSMGQGRYVHPSRRRTLTPREAARLQYFPDFFDFSATDRRGAWAKMIGNAVPPKLSFEICLQLLIEE